MTDIIVLTMKRKTLITGKCNSANVVYTWLRRLPSPYYGFKDWYPLCGLQGRKMRYQETIVGRDVLAVKNGF